MADYVVVDKVQLEADLTDIANAIREKNGGSDTYKPAVMGDAIRDIESGGNNPLKYAQTLASLFKAIVFDGIDFEISFGSMCTSEFSPDLFYCTFYSAMGLKSIKLTCGRTINTDLDMSNFCRGRGYDRDLIKIDLNNIVIPVNFFPNVFYERAGLKEILCVFDLTNCTKTTNCFYDCISLETVRFKANTIPVSLSLSSSPLLSDASIQSIIDGLATVETTQTLTLHADVKAKLTETQIATITGKNWTLA